MGFRPEPKLESIMAEKTERAVLAGGCFWIIQQLLRQRAGVVSTRVGWMGGEGDNPNEINNGGHAEVVEVIFDPDRLPYRGLLEYFFIVHRADLGADVVGTNYRSEIFYINEAQRMVAEETIRDVDASGHWPGRMATRVSKAGRFLAEPQRNQNYLQRFPLGCPAPFPRSGEQAGPT
jgi:peptide-methionine (S)-S-oxide reductase